MVKKYGQDRVSQIGTYTSLSTKAVLKDIARGLNIDHTIITEINKHVPVVFGKPYSISKCLEEVPTIQEYAEKYPELFEMALKVEGMPRSSSIHACFVAGTPVLTDAGYLPIEQVSSHHKVLTHVGTYQPVAHMMENGLAETVEVRFNSSLPVQTTANHPFFVREMSYRRLRKYKDGIDTRVKEFSSPSWKAVSDLKVGTDYVGFPIPTEEVMPTETHLPFMSRDFWWIVGRFIGDGWTESHVRNHRKEWVEKRLIICCGKHKNEVEDITKHLDALSWAYRVEENRTTFKIFINHPDMFEYLDNSCGKYAHGKKFPQDSFLLPIPLQEQLLEGYLSADGHKSTTGKIQIKTVSLDLINGFSHLVRRVHHRHINIGILPPKQEIIEGRIVQSKIKYNAYYTMDIRQKEQSFYEEINGVPYIWSRLHSIESLDEQLVYNLSVYNDNSYTVFGMAVHNCGVLVSPSSISTSVPVMRGKEGEMVSQYDGPTLEEFGFLKFDLLGLKNLSVVAIARDLVEERHGVSLNPDKFDPTDDGVYATIGNGRTLGIFQIESSGMSGVFKGLDTVNFESLIAGLSLYRPGPMDEIPEYQARANGMRDVSYFHPDAEPVLKKTFGIMIYQEQLMQLAGVFGGYTEGQQDSLRKATGKKSQKVMDQVLPELHARTLEQGYDEATADKLIELIKPFVGYGFNRSHAAA